MLFAERSFDGAYMLHVGMNSTTRKNWLARSRECCGPFLLWNIRCDADRAWRPAYPVPWATTADLSAVQNQAVQESAPRGRAFVSVSEQARLCLAFFARPASQDRGCWQAPTLGLHVLMGKSTSEKFAEYDR